MLVDKKKPQQNVSARPIRRQNKKKKEGNRIVTGKGPGSQGQKATRAVGQQGKSVDNFSLKSRGANDKRKEIELLILRSKVTRG